MGFGECCQFCKINLVCFFSTRSHHPISHYLAIQVVELLIARLDLQTIDLALRQPGIDAASLCRLLRLVSSFPDETTAPKESKGTDVVSTSIDKRHLLLRIVSLSVRDEDAKKVLKTIPVAETVGIIETLLGLLKRETGSVGEGDENEEEEEEEEEEERSSPLTLPHASLLHWITLLIDSHFLDFIMGDDEKNLELLGELEDFTHDLEGYFHTREALDGLLEDMKERVALYGGGASKTKMGSEDDYCIQVIDF